MAKKDAAGVPIVNVAEALKTQAKKATVTKTIRLRATQTGYYGLNGAIADIVPPGAVFQFAVKDLEPEGSHKGRDLITVDGVKYDLPSWCVDASAPVPREEEEEDESDADGGSDSVDVI